MGSACWWTWIWETRVMTSAATSCCGCSTANKTVQIVLFGRDDSEYWLNKSKDDEAFIAAISQQLHATLKLQQRFPGLGVLRIWNVE